MTTRRKIGSGVYLIIDPSMGERALLSKLTEAIRVPIAGVQIWDNFAPTQDRVDLVEKVCRICAVTQVPVLINNNWELVKMTRLDGVHFDTIPHNFEKINNEIGESYLMGITVSNDLSVVRWADENQLDYISFCSIFPSVTSNSCDRVSFKSIQETRKITSVPVFLSGGIRPGNIRQLKGLEFEGVAVVSGIMSSETPGIVTEKYLTELKHLKHEKTDDR